MVSLGIFSVVTPTEPCALMTTQPLRVNTRDFSWGKSCRCVWLTTYHPCSAETSRKSGVLTYPEPLGSPRPVAGNLYFLQKTFRTRSLLLKRGIRSVQVPFEKDFIVLVIIIHYFDKKYETKGDV